MNRLQLCLRLSRQLNATSDWLLNVNVKVVKTCTVSKKNVFSSLCSSNSIFSSDLEEEAEVKQLLHDREYGEYARMHNLQLPGLGHGIFIIHPDVRQRGRSAESEVKEACALVETLPGWSVVDKKIYRSKRPQSKRVFGSGRFAELEREVRGRPGVSAVLVNTERLSLLQTSQLQAAFRVPVIDRYGIVLQIFRHHARSSVARLQVALAEIPYLRSRLRGTEGDGLSKCGRSGETGREKAMKLLDDREVKLKKALEEVSKKRHVLKRQRSRLQLPTAAVVGYTNAGKTSLIRALTGDEAVKPRNRLFATLDVTVHGVKLPARLDALLMDTVGFISHIPTSLMHSFSATLEDALHADVIVHVRDVSSEDAAAQKAEVLRTLERLKPGLAANVIDVANKADLVPPDGPPIDDTDVVTSCADGRGLSQLAALLEERLVGATGRRHCRLLVPQAGPHLRWLHKETTVVCAEACGADAEKLHVKCVMTPAVLARYKALFSRKRQSS